MRIKVTWPYFVSRYLLQCRIQDIFNIDDGGMQAGCENISTKILKRESSAFTFPGINKGSSPQDGTSTVLLLYKADRSKFLISIAFKLIVLSFLPRSGLR